MMLDVMTSLPQDQSKLNFDFVEVNISLGSGVRVNYHSISLKKYVQRHGGGNSQGNLQGNPRGPPQSTISTHQVVYECIHVLGTCNLLITKLPLERFMVSQ